MLLALSLPLRLLTFDLDDTLFPCAPVVARANAALVEALADRGIVGLDGKAIQARMKEVRVQVGRPVTYTQLRKLGIASLITEQRLKESGSVEFYTPDADACFDVWLDERQAAANELLYPGVVDALDVIREAHPQALIGAITNGRGDPREMPAISSFFDFYLSGEEDGIFPDNKPAARFYEETLQRALECGRTQKSAGARGAGNLEALQSSWVHVGDSLVKDCEAARAVGAETVWLSQPAEELNEASYSTVSPEEAARRAAAAEAALKSGCVGRRIEAIAELPVALNELLGLRGGEASPRAFLPTRATSGLDVLTMAAASFALVCPVSTLFAATGQALRGAPSASAARMGLAEGLRWGRVSATFSGLTSSGQWQRWPERRSLVVAAAGAGAAGAGSLSAAPVRAAAFAGLALAIETGGPSARLLGERIVRAVDAELLERQAQFARGTVHGADSSSSVSVRLRDAGGGEGGPWQRLQRLVDQLNRELGHAI